MNTKFRYLYRDADNYKEYSELVFEGEPTEGFERRIREACRQSALFVAEAVRVPTVYLWEGEDSFDYDPAAESVARVRGGRFDGGGGE